MERIPNKPNYLLAYALKKLPEGETLKFKNVDFNESSKGFVDLYASLHSWMGDMDLRCGKRRWKA